MAKKTKKAAPQSRETARIKSFLDMIAPSVVKFEPDHFICGNTFRCVWALREYPTQTDEQAILRHLGEKDGITLRIYTRQVTPAEEKRIIQNAANKNRMGSSNTNDLQQTITAESNLQDVASLVASIIYSLRREDADRLEYDNADAWRALLMENAPTLAKSMKISLDNFHWYAAFHDEGHHPHIHMMVWSDDPKEGFLTRDGIATMRSKLTNAIFRDEIPLPGSAPRNR